MGLPNVLCTSGEQETMKEQELYVMGIAGAVLCILGLRIQQVDQQIDGLPVFIIGFFLMVYAAGKILLDGP